MKPELAVDPCKDPKYQEPAIDAMRVQKDEVELLCRSSHALIILIVLRNHLVLP